MSPAREPSVHTGVIHPVCRASFSCAIDRLYLSKYHEIAFNFHQDVTGYFRLRLCYTSLHFLLCSPAPRSLRNAEKKNVEELGVASWRGSEAISAYPDRGR